MAMKRSQHNHQQGREQGIVLQRLLLVFMLLCVVGITLSALIIAQRFWNIFIPEPHPTATPIVVVSPSPTQKQTPSPTSTPTPTPTQAPSPTPTQAPGVLGYPLYGGNIHRPEIALTFDDGPNPPYTSQILTILHTYGVKATFFVIGTNAATYPNLVQQEYQDGHVVGNHTWTHPDLTQLTVFQVRDQLQRTSEEMRAITGVSPSIFRPPGGNFNETVQSVAASLGLSTIVWDVDPRDWSQPGVDVIIQRVLATVHNGSIILLHDGGGDRSETVAALPTIITTLEQRGFQFVTIPRLIQDL
jgi:peptidoglycan/xylan/chitin deacetylase (PgdA/CDA1 family)